MAQKTSIPKGTRDFSPIEMAKRNYIFDTIRDVFSLYGFRQIETPAMENLSTLMGKYGEEGDKLLFKILNSGDYTRGIDSQLFQSGDFTHLTPKIAEKGLRYDLTVPFARYVVQHRNDLKFPFKRYQIQPVWRADRPQKGRYREFYQCDADIIGSKSLLNEVELLTLIDNVFERLGVNVTIHINNRKVLAGIAEKIGEPERLIDITVAIDKLDKIGIDKVKDELTQRGLSEEAINALIPIININGSTEERLESLADVLKTTEIGSLGVKELQTVFENVRALNIKADIQLDVSLARGLNYYTGTIIEVKANDVEIGSITGGGRYDNLTGVFGLPDVSGVGISFGADRIYDVLNTLNLYPADILSATKVLFINFGEQEAKYALACLSKMRAARIASELYPDSTKMKKQMDYANDYGIPFVILIGENEMNQNLVTLKDMTTGEQKSVDIDTAISEISAKLA